jgi:phosphomevalonate decarboxylase
MKATAVAHPIQGLVKYHGMRDPDLRLPYHDSISVCTAPSRTRTTVEWGHDADALTIDGEEADDLALERVTRVLDRVRALADRGDGARVASENNFPSNVGLGASSSAFAALAFAACRAADLELDRPAISAVARRGASSAARSVTGGFSQLRASMRDEDCVSERLDDGFGDDLRIVIGLVPAHKHTARAHEEAEESPFFRARLARMPEAIAEMRSHVQEGDREAAFALAERDSLSLLATTMTGPENWIYWRPETLELLRAVRRLREEDSVPVHFSTDTGATAYLNTTADAADRVAEVVEDLGLDSMTWEVGGPARTVDDHLF